MKGMNPLAARAAALLLGLAATVAPGSSAAARQWTRADDSAILAQRTSGVALAESTVILGITTIANDIGLLVYNQGFFGTNLRSRNPSMEYPRHNDQEHLVRAGIWIAGISASGEDTLCSTSTLDGSVNDTRYLQNTEFIPLPPYQFKQRSTLSEGPLGRYWDPDSAKSEQDILCSFGEKAEDVEARHKPLGVKVNLELLQFSFEPFDAIIIANYKIININQAEPIYNAYVGMYSELASGYKGQYVTFPPSGWFDKKDIAYVDSLRMMSEHHYNYDNGQCPSWAGISVLGTRPKPVGEMTVSFNWWDWDPDFNFPGTPKNDAERYRMMSNGAIDGTAGSEAPNTDPVELLSVGPFEVIEPGDTVSVTFAFLGGKPSPAEDRNAEEDLAYNAQWAQTAFDLNFRIPVPPPSPTLRVTPRENSLVLRWTRGPEDFRDPKSGQKDFEGYRVYVGETADLAGFRQVRQFDVVDSLLENTGLEEIRWPDQVDSLATEYRYEIPDVRDGFKYWVSVTSFDTGTQEIGPLESGLSQARTFVIPGRGASPAGQVKVFPNPYRGDAAWDGTLERDRYLWFVNLPHRCTIRIYTLAGDLVDTIEFDGATYDATDVRGIYDPTDVANPETDVPTLSGGMAAWDLVSRNDQGIASGLYIFSVEDHGSGKTQLGKFVVLK